MHWKSRIYKSAYSVAEKISQNPKVLAVAFGGSVAKGMVWKHSDLELCIIADGHISEYEYFNYIENLGVEIIQIEKSNILKFVKKFKTPDKDVLAFPIQIYKCKVVYDPQGILSPFKEIYDKALSTRISQR